MPFDWHGVGEHLLSSLTPFLLLELLPVVGSKLLAHAITAVEDTFHVEIVYNPTTILRVLYEKNKINRF